MRIQREGMSALREPRVKQKELTVADAAEIFDESDDTKIEHNLAEEEAKPPIINDEIHGRLNKYFYKQGQQRSQSSRPKIKIRLKGAPFFHIALVDTGSDLNLLDHDFAKNNIPYFEDLFQESDCSRHIELGDHTHHGGLWQHSS